MTSKKVAGVYSTLWAVPLMPLIFVCVTCKAWQNNLAFSVGQIILVTN